MPQRKRDSRSGGVLTEASASPPSRNLIVAGAILIATAVFVAYSPALEGGFIWDDNTYVINNSRVTKAEGLSQIWFSSKQEEYYPASYSIFWLQWRLWKSNPVGYHIINFALHIAVALLVWLLLWELSIPGGYLAALLFAVHPVNVEAVAWIFQCRGLLATFFSLLSIFWYLRAYEFRETQYEQGRPGQPNRSGVEGRNSTGNTRYYWISLIAFITAMLSKGSVAVVPPLILLMVWWKSKRLTKADLVRCAPFFIVAVVLTSVNIWFQTHGTGKYIRPADTGQRLAGAGAIVWFYLSKALLPIRLLFVYPQWSIQTSDLRWWLPLVTALGITAILYFRRNTSKPTGSRPLFVAWVAFCVALVPVMGLTDAYFMKFSLVADHYEYISLIGVTALVGAGWKIWNARTCRIKRLTSVICAVVGVMALFLLTLQQSRLYKDAITLFRATLENNPECWMAHNNLGIELDRIGQSNEAIEQYKQVIRIKPDYAEAYNNIGDTLLHLHRPQEAITQLEHALQLKPNYPNARYNLGKALAETARPQDAIVQYQAALKLQIDLTDAQNELGNTLLATHRFKEAIDHFENVLKIRCESAESKYERPLISQAYFNLALALQYAGRTQEAIQQYQQALSLNPDYAEAHNNLGMALTDAGNLNDAIKHYEAAVRLKPDYAVAYNNLANALLDSGQPQAAIEQYRHSLRLQPEYVEAWFNMASAYIQMGRPDDAAGAAQKALDLARVHGQTEVGQKIEAWLKAHPSSMLNSK